MNKIKLVNYVANILNFGNLNPNTLTSETIAQVQFSLEFEKHCLILHEYFLIYFDGNMQACINLCTTRIVYTSVFYYAPPVYAAFIRPPSLLCHSTWIYVLLYASKFVYASHVGISINVQLMRYYTKYISISTTAMKVCRFLQETLELEVINLTSEKLNFNWFYRDFHLENDLIYSDILHYHFVPEIERIFMYFIYLYYCILTRWFMLAV